MKHTLKAKYASDGIQARRQRVEASQPAVVARQREATRRQEVVDRVSARFAESSRPKHDNLAASSKATRAAAMANMVKWYSDAMNKSFFAALSSMKTREHDDQLDAIQYAFMASPRCVGKVRLDPFAVPVTYTAVGAGRPDMLIADDVLAL